MNSYGVFFGGRRGTLHLLIFETATGLPFSPGDTIDTGELSAFSDRNYSEALIYGNSGGNVRTHREGNNIQMEDMERRYVDTVTVKKIFPIAQC